MKMVFLATAGAVAAIIVSPARAADLPVPANAPVPVYNWTGFYAGPNLGFAAGHTSYSGVDASGAATSGSYSTSGPFGGGQVGANYEFWNHHGVIGVETDFEASGLTGSNNSCVGASCSTVTAQASYFGTVRGRLGYVWDNVLLYGTGGWLYGWHTATVSVVGGRLNGDIASSSGDLSSGWTAGGGVEVGFLPNWTVKLEYLHLQYATSDTFNFTPVLASHSTATHATETGRVGLNYLFNFGSVPAPLVARN